MDQGISQINEQADNRHGAERIIKDHRSGSSEMVAGVCVKDRSAKKDGSDQQIDGIGHVFFTFRFCRLGGRT